MWESASGSIFLLFTSIFAGDVGFTASDGTFTDKVVITSDTTPPEGTYVKVYRADGESETKELLGTTTTNSYSDTTVTVGITYYYFLKGCDGSYCSAFTNYDTGYAYVAPFDAPTNITASDDLFTDKVVISNYHVDGATAYRIYKSTSPDTVTNTNPIANLSEDSFEDKFITPGTTTTTM